MFSVVAARPSDRDSWDAFVHANERGTFFHLFTWRDVIADVFGHKTHYLIAKNGSEVLGLLPLVEQRSLLFGRMMSSTPFCMYGGPLFNTTEIRDRLLRKAAEIAQHAQSRYLEIRSIDDLEQGWPHRETYVRFRKAISDNHERNEKDVPRKQRAMIRKGRSAGLRANANGDLEQFFHCYSTSVRNLGTPVFPRRFFHALQAAFGNRCEVLNISKDGRPVASVMSFYFRDEVLPMYGGGTLEARSTKANDFMYWELMRRAANRGVVWFDFGRSRVGSGSYRFKKHWGFVPEPLAYQYYVEPTQPVPNLSPENPKFKWLIATWKKLPLRVSQVLGPMVSPYLG